ncbi:MAG: DUF971 domain-containing protein [Bdellovibrionales bacterium]|nr:DUF971 domain-containing protein [Bdellovibrionales bacterium]
MERLTEVHEDAAGVSRERGTGLRVTWSDHLTAAIGSTPLRTHCPCATCKERRGDQSHAKPLAPKINRLNVLSASREEELDLIRVWAIGNYALGIEWGDKHNSGIYTFSHLRQLSEEANAHPANDTQD